MKLVLFLVCLALVGIGLVWRHAQARARHVENEPQAAPVHTELEKNNALIEQIGQEIINSEKLATLDWKSVSIVFDIGHASIANSGFAYLDDKIVPTSVGGPRVSDYVRALRDGMSRLGKGAPVQMLVQISHEGKFKIDFEYDDPSRWRIGPANLDQMQEMLRPQFAS